MKKITEETFVDMIKLINWKITAYFIILLVMFILNIFMLRNISNQLYWHNKTSIEAMACVKDVDCSLDPLLEYDYYPPED